MAGGDEGGGSKSRVTLAFNSLGKSGSVGITYGRLWEETQVEQIWAVIENLGARTTQGPWKG